MGDTSDAKHNANKPTWPFKSETVMTPAPNGQWMKKHKSKPYYFGVWADPDAALHRWRAEWPTITAGGNRPLHTTGRGAITVHQLCTAYLAARQADVKCGTLHPRSFADYRRTTRRINARLAGRHVHTLTAVDFSGLLHAQKCGVYDRTKIVTHTRMIFRWGDESGLIDPCRFGPDFRGVPMRFKRKHRRETQGDIFTGPQVVNLLSLAAPILRAAIYLGINGGYEPEQVCKLRGTDINLKNAIIVTTRDKTETKRIIPLWPETVDAIKAVYSDGFIFVNKHGRPLSHGTTYGLTRTFTKLLKAAGLHSMGKSFYQLRRTFCTLADEVGDQKASEVIMGHTAKDIHDLYVLRFSRPRLKKVVDHVRDQLFGKMPNGSSLRR